MKELPACLDVENPSTALAEDCQVTVTPAALDLLKQIQTYHGPVSIHHQGGYANGADTLCLPVGEMRTGDGDVLLGTVQNTPIFVFGVARGIGMIGNSCWMLSSEIAAVSALIADQGGDFSCAVSTSSTFDGLIYDFSPC